MTDWMASGSVQSPSARPVPCRCADLLTIGRHLGPCRFRFKALARAAVELQHLHARQIARLEAQQLAAVGQGRVPARGEETALPAVHAGAGCLGVGGNVWWHGEAAGSGELCPEPYAAINGPCLRLAQGRTAGGDVNPFNVHGTQCAVHMPIDPYRADLGRCGPMACLHPDTERAFMRIFRGNRKCAVAKGQGPGRVAREMTWCERVGVDAV